MNIILRRCLAMLNLTMIKRDYFDSEAAENIPVIILKTNDFLFNFEM